MYIVGPPSETNRYLFNGDIVDKGEMSVECILLLFLMKLAYPQWVYINRYGISRSSPFLVADNMRL